eukprot:SAG31_NODE_774_length_12192_cov_26.736128_7_plen_38_part_00
MDFHFAIQQHEPVTMRKIFGVTLAVFAIFLLGNDEDR